MQNIKMIRYSVQRRIFVKVYELLSYVKNIGENIGKNFGGSISKT